MSYGLGFIVLALVTLSLWACVRMHLIHTRKKRRIELEESKRKEERERERERKDLEQYRDNLHLVNYWIQKGEDGTLRVRSLDANGEERLNHVGSVEEGETLIKGSLQVDAQYWEKKRRESDDFQWEDLKCYEPESQ